MVHEQVRILAVEDIAQDIYRLRISAPDIVAQGIKPGQFVHVRLPVAMQHLLRRPISVMSVRPEQGEFDLVIQKAGEGTRLLRSVRPDDELSILGPLGKPFDAKGAKRIFFVGGGVGVAPVRCAMEAFARDGCQGTAFFGFRSAKHAYALEDAPCEVRISTDDGSMGRHAFVTDLMQEAIETQPPDLIIACGPTPMLRTVQNLATRQHIPCQISLEEYMACGMGACLVCSCKIRAFNGMEYRRVCVDGPVFDAKEVCFDG